MNPRDVPDDVYAALAEVATVLSTADYVTAYEPPAGTGVTSADATAAVRRAREAPL